MKERKITEDQIQKIANVLLEIQAKFSLEALDILRSLPIIAEPIQAE
jgi:hypothetical protein